MASKSVTVRSREEVVAELETIAEYMQILGESVFKVRAFQKGAAAVAGSDAGIDQIASGAAKLAGVGEGIRTAIQEFLEKGEASVRSELSGKIPAGVLELIRVPGLGPKRAFKLHEEHGIRSMDELEKACRENRLASFKGFGLAQQNKILQKIEDLHQNSDKLRVNVALARYEAIAGRLASKLGPHIGIFPVGELGRFSETVSRIEACFSGSAENCAAAITAFDWVGGLAENRFSVQGTEIAGFTGKLRDGLEVTFWASEQGAPDGIKQWLCASSPVRDLIVTDPARFKGWEPDWLEPEWTTGGREPQPSTYRISRDGGVKGIFHVHTEESDGRGSLEEMVKGAEKLGYQFIGISDHSQSAAYAHGLDPKRVSAQKKAIAELQRKVGIRIFHGIESDILVDGSLDYSPEILASFDFVVASIHSRFEMDAVAMTERLVKAISNPFTTIWGHPTGRLLLERRPYLFSWQQCLDAAVSNETIIEINSHPQRLDLDWRLGAEIEKRRLRVSIDPDAHEVAGLRDVAYGERVAQKAMISRELIFNLQSVDEVEKQLWQRKKRASR